MYVKTLVLVGLVFSMLGGVAVADDKDDIMALIDDYCRLQGTGDLMGQANMMTADRIFILGGVRETNQAANMKQQQAAQDTTKKLDPERVTIVTATDPIVRVYGDAAVASFYWHFQNVFGADFIKMTAPNVPSGSFSYIVTQVFVKEGGTWKIDYTHLSSYGDN
jgi:ketosteroid isomerase-like protein